MIIMFMYAGYVEEKWPNALARDKIMKKPTQKCTDAYTAKTKELARPHVTPVNVPTA